MTKIWPTATALTAVGALALTGCGTTDDAADDDRLHVVSSFSILSDIVEEIGGEDVAVHNIVPVGNDPHEYEATPSDTKALSDASAYFYNGLNLEGGDQGWAARMVESVDFDQDHVYETLRVLNPNIYLMSNPTTASTRTRFWIPMSGWSWPKMLQTGLAKLTRITPIPTKTTWMPT